MKYTYECFYQRQRVTVTNDGGTLAAQKEAARILKVPAKKQYLITVVLAGKDGLPVPVDPASL